MIEACRSLVDGGRERPPAAHLARHLLHLQLRVPASPHYSARDHDARIRPNVGKLRNLSQHPSKLERDRMKRMLASFFDGKGAELVPMLDARDAVEKWKAA